MGDGVEGLGQVYGHDGRAGRGFALIKPHSNGLDQWEEGGCGGSEGAETMLGVREGEGGSEVGEQQALQHLHRRAEKGDWTVGGTERGGLAGLGDGDEGGGLPDGGD